VPTEKQRAYAQRIQARRAAKVRELKASTRTIELICFLRVTLLDLTDALLYQTGVESPILCGRLMTAPRSDRHDQQSSIGRSWLRSRCLFRKMNGRRKPTCVRAGLTRSSDR
jgi:hypothetical protein